MSGEKKGVRDNIDRMVGDIVSDGKVSRDRAYEIARKAARRVEHGEAAPCENWSKDRDKR